MNTTDRPCYICEEKNNPIIASESIEYRFGRPLMPEGVYRFARCHKCSTLYVDSDVTDEYLAEIYANETVDTTREVKGGIDHTQVIVSRRLPEFHRHWAYIKRFRSPQLGDRLLDIGCQTGDFGAVVQGDGVQPNGIELSTSYAEICRTRWGSNAHVFCGTLETAPFEAGQFEYITAFETLEHMCDPIEALRRMRRWLAPGGVLAISVPSSDYFHFKYWILRKSPITFIMKPLFERRAAVYKQRVLPHTHIYNFSHTSIKLMLERAGFRPMLVGGTGWHGRLGSLMDPFSRALEGSSRGRLGLAPSLFAVALPQHNNL